MARDVLKVRFLKVLDEHQGSAGNRTLLASLGWTEETYWNVHAALVEDGVIIKGRGRGGSVQLRIRAAAPLQPGKSETQTSSKEQISTLEPLVRAENRSKKTRDTKKSNVGFERTLWAAADKLRGNMDAAEYKHVALGLIFLKYISDRFEERRAKALADPEEVDLVDERDLYVGDNVFWVPENARWAHLASNATSVQPTVGALIDQAMLDLEAENSSLRGVLIRAPRH